MKPIQKNSKILGVAFLFQFFTSFISNVFIYPQATGISALRPAGNISQILEHIANHSGLMHLFITLDMFTALGVTFLGAVLYLTLRKENEIAALTGFGFYILEGALITASKLNTFPLLSLSREFISNGLSENLLTLAQLNLDSMSLVGGTMANFAFCFGAVLLYFLLHRAHLVPKALSLWGLIAILPFLVGIPLKTLGVDVPFYLYVPYIPFEFSIGLWIVLKGLSNKDNKKI